MKPSKLINQVNRNILLRQIESSFNSLELHDGVSLHEAVAIDDCLSEAECAAARELDRESSWQDVRDSAIRKHSSCLYFMDDLGTRYYLPAYMIWSLNNYENSDSLSISHAASKLKTCRAGQFAHPQCQAIQAYLQYMASHYKDADAQEALSVHWSNIAVDDQVGDEQPAGEEDALEGLLRSASHFIRFRRFSRAIPRLEEALSQSADPPQRSCILTMLSQCYQDAQDWEKSIARLEQATLEHSDNFNARLSPRFGMPGPRNKVGRTS